MRRTSHQWGGGKVHGLDFGLSGCRADVKITVGSSRRVGEVLALPGGEESETCEGETHGLVCLHNEVEGWQLKVVNGQMDCPQFERVDVEFQKAPMARGPLHEGVREHPTHLWTHPPTGNIEEELFGTVGCGAKCCGLAKRREPVRAEKEGDEGRDVQQQGLAIY